MPSFNESLIVERGNLKENRRNNWFSRINQAYCFVERQGYNNALFARLGAM